MTNKNVPKIIIVGGGAGGIELVALLGNKLGKRNKAHITLIDTSPTHLWKPLLHEVAAGTLNSNEDELSYLMYASDRNFQFLQGTLEGIDRSKKEIILSPIKNDTNQEIVPKRNLAYDILVIAIGSISNDFGIPGVSEYCFFIDNRKQADIFHKALLAKLMQFSYQTSVKEKLNIAIVGGGATGIELVAELHNAIQLMSKYGMNINPKHVSFSLIEAADKLLPMLPDALSTLVYKELKKLEVDVYLNEQVSQVNESGFLTRSGKFIEADIKIWTAGIKAPDILKHFDGLEVNRINQLLVKQTLQTTLDDSIFAMGDCASCPRSDSDKPVPPRAQSAHQEAVFLAKALPAYLEKKSLLSYHYHDYGSLVTLSHYQVVGNLMGKITKSILVEGKLARLFYLSLYKQHQISLYGYWRVLVLTFANLLSRKIKPRLKLH